MPGQKIILSGQIKRLAATYSRGSYTTTTIGHAVFAGRVRDGNGSDHCGIATKLVRTFFDVQNILKRSCPNPIRRFSENYTQEALELFSNSRVEIAFQKRKSNQAARPISVGQLNASRQLHFQPIKRVVCPWSLGTCVRETISWDELGT